MERDTSRNPLGLIVGLGQPLTDSFLGVESAEGDTRVLLGCKDFKKGVTGTDIPLGLGPSSGSSCVPSDVAGLARPVRDDTRPCENELFGRPKACSDCGREPAPTLAEKELLDVFREVVEFERDENEEANDGLRDCSALVVLLAAEPTVLEGADAGALFLIGSPPFSTSVLLFDADSGTAIYCQKNDMSFR